MINILLRQLLAPLWERIKACPALDTGVRELIYLVLVSWLLSIFSEGLFRGAPGENYRA